ncbi:MAG: hypothetical protein WB538_19205 [Candidatus Sulfotelmatobacter sp.]
MAIEKADLSGSLNRNEMAPVVLTSTAQNRGAPNAEERQPRRREPSAEKDSEPPAEGTENAEDTDKTEQTKETEQTEDTENNTRPPHRIDRLA